MRASFDRYRAMEVLIRVADSGSFSAAARSLQLTPAAVSKQIARLEEHLGTVLLTRSTRSQTLTATGTKYVACCRQILAQVTDAERSIHEAEGRVVGRLRITAPTVFGRHRVMPAVTGLLEAWPQLDVDAQWTDTPLDIYATGIDVAIRLAQGSPKHNLIGRRIGEFQRLLVASPAYIGEYGAPGSYQELIESHRGLVFQPPGHSRIGWTVSSESGTYTRLPHCRLQCNHSEAIVDAALAGLGIADLPDYLVAEQLANGTLMRILPKVAMAKVGVWALAASRRQPPRVREFLRILEAKLSTR